MSETRECPDCSGTCLRSMVFQKFEYGQGDEYTLLAAFVPVWTCGICSFAFTDGDAEALRTKAVSEHLGRLKNDGCDDLLYGRSCGDCGSPICWGGCRIELDFDDPLDDFDEGNWCDDMYDDTRDDAEDNFEELYEGPDGCMNCGRFASDCVCFSDDHMMSADDWEEMELLAWRDRYDVENFHRFRDVLTRRSKFLHLCARKAADAEDSNFDLHGFSHGNVWKHSNRSAHKQWRGICRFVDPI